MHCLATQWTFGPILLYSSQGKKYPTEYSLNMPHSTHTQKERVNFYVNQIKGVKNIHGTLFERRLLITIEDHWLFLCVGRVHSRMKEEEKTFTTRRTVGPTSTNSGTDFDEQWDRLSQLTRAIWGWQKSDTAWRGEQTHIFTETHQQVKTQWKSSFTFSKLKLLWKATCLHL